VAKGRGISTQHTADHIAPVPTHAEWQLATSLARGRSVKIEAAC